MIDPRTLENSQILRVFQALDTVTFHVSDAEPALKFRAIAEELLRRGLIRKWHAEHVIDALSTARLNNEAIAFAKPFQITPKLLEARGMGGINRTLVVFDKNKQWSDDFVFPPGGFVIVVGLPKCHFTKNAADDITSDADLSLALKKSSRWVIPQTRGISNDDVIEWNRNHRDLPLSVLWRQSQWPELKGWETPTFYFFKDGKLVDRLVGWKGAKAVHALREKIQRVGINTPNVQT